MVWIGREGDFLGERTWMNEKAIQGKTVWTVQKVKSVIKVAVKT
jgi:hypothetical protein